MFAAVSQLTIQNLLGRQDRQISNLLVGAGERRFGLRFRVGLRLTANFAGFLFSASANILGNFFRIAGSGGAYFLRLAARFF